MSEQHEHIVLTPIEEEVINPKARIRELESEVELLRAANEAAVTIGLEQRDNLWERIAKAKAILSDILEWRNHHCEGEIKEALEALDGK